MQIVICTSLDFTFEIKNARDELVKKGHTVIIPRTSEMILKNKVSLEQVKKEKKNGKISKRAIKYNVIRYYFDRIKEADVVLILNLEKNGIKNYVGGNTFLEIGFAYILNKKIFFLNPIPEMIYKDEIKAMRPFILNGDLSLIV